MRPLDTAQGSQGKSRPPQDYLPAALAELLLGWIYFPDEVSQFVYYHGQFADHLPVIFASSTWC